MRRSVSRGVQDAARAIRTDGATFPFKTPFVCRSCRRTAVQTSLIARARSQRPFSTAIPRSQQTSTAEGSAPQRESVAPQTHYDFFPDTFPDGPPPHSPFTPDLRQLRKEFLQLQAKAHPDRAPSGQKRHAEALSMRLNEAYRAIQDPLKRAQYLLSLQGIDVEDESAKLEESELLMEVMEAREAVEEVESEEQLVELREENNERIERSVAVLEAAFAKSDMNEAAQEAIRLRYWKNIEESIQGWEKGRGGGVLHH